LQILFCHEGLSHLINTEVVPTLTPENEKAFPTNFVYAMRALTLVDFNYYFDTFERMLNPEARDAIQRLKLRETAKCWAYYDLKPAVVAGFANTTFVQGMRDRL
jgi:hypothetical protein